MRWSLQELEYLKTTYPSNISLNNMAEELGRSTKAIKHKAARMKLSRLISPINKPKNINHRNEYDQRYYSLYKKEIYQNKKERIRVYKLKLVELLGGKCRQCGYDRCPTALDFHHIDEQKENSISSLLHRVSREKILKEAKKCILLCANCHRELHHNKRGRSITR